MCRDLNENEGKTIVAVLHDLNQACRYADNMIAMKDGEIIGQGHPADIVTPELVRQVFGLDCLIIADPVTGTPLTLPLVRARARVAGLGPGPVGSHRPAPTESR